MLSGPIRFRTRPLSLLLASIFSGPLFAADLDPGAELPQLLQDLGHVDFSVREMATIRLRAMGEEIKPRLDASLYASINPEIRCRINEIIHGTCQQGRFLDAWIEVLKIPRHRDISKAHAILSGTAPETLPFMSNMLREKDPLVRTLGLGLAANLGEKAQVTYPALLHHARLIQEGNYGHSFMETSTHPMHVFLRLETWPGGTIESTFYVGARGPLPERNLENLAEKFQMASQAKNHLVVLIAYDDELPQSHANVILNETISCLLLARQNGIRHLEIAPGLQRQLATATFDAVFRQGPGRERALRLWPLNLPVYVAEVPLP